MEFEDLDRELSIGIGNRELGFEIGIRIGGLNGALELRYGIRTGDQESYSFFTFYFLLLTFYFLHFTFDV